MTPPAPARVAIILNPYSGAGRPLRELATTLREALTAQGAESCVWLTLTTTDLADLVRMGHEWGATEWWIGGGDGTLATFAHHYHALELQAPVLFLPLGTACQIARRLDFPAQLEAVLARRPAWAVRPHDLYSTSHGRTGLLATGIGTDARAMATVDQGLKRVMGEVAYYQSLLRELFTMRPFTTHIEWEGGTYSDAAVEVLIANANPFEGPLASLVPQATTTDGMLDLLIFRASQPSDVWRQIAALVASRAVEDPDILTIRTPWVRIATTEPVPVQVDGDAAGEVTAENPLELRVIPGAFPMLVPPQVTDPKPKGVKK